MMRSKILTACLSLGVLAGCIGAGPTSDVASRGEGFFPDVVGIDLEGRERNLPETFDSRHNLVAIGFEREHQDAIDTWIARLDELRETDPDLAFFEVPVIEKLSMPMRLWVNNGMRSGIPDEAARKRTITVYTDKPTFRAPLGIADETAIHTLLLNDKGRVLGHWRGPADEDGLAELTAMLASGPGDRETAASPSSER